MSLSKGTLWGQCHVWPEAGPALLLQDVYCILLSL